MNNTSKRDDCINHLLHQLSVARNEVKNLRQEVIKLKHTYKNDVEEIQNLIKNSKCVDCQKNRESEEKGKSEKANNNCTCEFPFFRSIGTIESWFLEKRGTPRQASLCTETQGVLTLFPSVINNPDYAIKGLEEFSHLWIIYHFHRTDSNHIQTKVAPPKLNGERVGVFGTRSPHRPCPIGLSVVKIDKLTDNKIYFSGVDMLNGTPVLDIKPYIPHYDNPTLLYQQSSREIEGRHADNEISSNSGFVKNTEERTESREAPDGEEESIKVPFWLLNSINKKLKVEFTKQGLFHLNEMSQSEQLKKTIINIVEEDPRSVYLKQKLGDQFYTFLIKGIQVTCKFDDKNGVVVIHKLKEVNQDCECGIPKWQCSEHAD